MRAAATSRLSPRSRYGTGVDAGTTNTFSVVTDDPNNTFQWQQDGVDLPGQTGSSYTTHPMLPSEDGTDFSVVVTNGAGSTTSTPADLQVLPPNDPSQTITFAQPAAQTYGAAPVTLVATASSNLPVTFTWVSGPGVLSGTNGTTLTITGANANIVVRASQAGYSSADRGLYYNAAATVDRTIVISKKALTVTAVDKSRTYGAANPTLTASFTGFVNGDTTAVVSGAPALSSTAVATSGVGSYPITSAVGTLAATSYSFTFVNGSLSVTKAPLTVTAANASRVYAATNPTFTASYSGFLNSDTSAVVTGTPTIGTTAVPTSSAGTYPITPAVGSLTATNYSFGTFSNGTLTVTKATLGVTADDKSRAFGAANPALTASYTGFANGDTSAVLSGVPGLATAATNTSDVGSYPITAAVGTLTAANYTFGPFTSGTLTVTKGAQTTPLTVTSASSITYGAAYTATATGGNGTGALAWALGTGSTAPGAAINATTGVVTYMDAGTVTFTVRRLGDANYSDSSTTTFTLTVAGTLPVISVQPASRTVSVHVAAVFSVTATGHPAPTYQWRVNTANIAGATSSTYTVTDPKLTDSGKSYDVVVTNSAGSVTSTAAILTVVAGSNDFNGDGHPDLLWRNIVTGDTGLWYMNGTNWQ